MQLSLEECLYYESMFEVVKKPDKYILILNRGTYAETLVNVFDTEIQALQIARKCSPKERTLLKGTAVYIVANDNEIYSRCEDVEVIE